MTSEQSSDHSAASATTSPRKAVSTAVRRRLHQCYDHAKKLSGQKTYDFDYAHTLLAECVMGDPGNVVYVASFLKNLRRKYNNKRGVRFKVFSGKGAFKKRVAIADWPEVLRLGPQLLKTNPWDVFTLRSLARACSAMDFPEVELRYLKMAQDAAPKNAELFRQCAEALTRQGNFDEAIECWHRVEELNHGDRDALRMISQLTLDQNCERPEASLIEPKSRPTALKQFVREQPVNLEQPEEDDTQRREIPLTPRQQLEQDIQHDPTEIENYLKLAQLLESDGRAAEAEQTLVKAVSAAGADLDVRKELENLQIRRAEQRLDIAENKAYQERTVESVELVDQIQDELNRLELDIYHSRCERFPDDLQSRFEVAIRLKRVGNYSEAIDRFQEVRSKPRWRIAATLAIGECLQHLRQYSLSLPCYTRAIEFCEKQQDQPDEHKLALYRAGILSMGLEKFDEAQEYLSKLAQLDPEYKDLPCRLDKLKEIRHKG